MLSPEIWFITSIALLLLGFTAYLRFFSRLKTTLERLETESNKHLDEVKTAIETNLRPTIHLHDSPAMVARRAAGMITAACHEQDTTRRFIEFYGAASLSAMSGRDADGDGEGRYNAALEDATKNNVMMHRYVSLFSERELSERSWSVKKRYLAWLRRQQYQLANDEFYQIVDVVRAPKWGANMARIVTAGAVMEITGNGQAAIVIQDENAAATIREYARNAVLSGKNRPERYGLSISEKTLLEFRRYIDRISETTIPDNQENQQQDIEDN